MGTLESRLSGGHSNSLGNTVEVVEDVLADPELFAELFNCYFSEDEVVRLRVSNAMKRIAKENKHLLIPYIDRFLTDIAAIDQASTQWTLAQLFDMLSKDLSQEQEKKAREIVKYNLATHQDWIVLNQSMETLGKWAKKDGGLKSWLKPHLERLERDGRKSVAKKAAKWMGVLY